MDHVSTLIAAHPVVVFSKTYCPFCVKAKKALAPLVASHPPEFIKVLELENHPEMNKIQDALASLTGARSVPRVFIGGKFIGGGDDTVHLAATGELKKLIEEVAK